MLRTKIVCTLGPASDAEETLRAFVEADMAVATRMKAGSDDIDSSFSCFVRNAGGMLLTQLINLRFGSRITDALNGFRALRADKAGSLKLAADDFDVEHEMIMKALKRGWRDCGCPQP